MDKIDSYTADHMHNSEIRIKSNILNSRSENRISNGGFNAFRSLTEEEQTEFNRLLAEEKEKCNSIKTNIGALDNFKESVMAVAADKINYFKGENPLYNQFVSPFEQMKNSMLAEIKEKDISNLMTNENRS